MLSLRGGAFLSSPCCLRSSVLLAPRLRISFQSLLVFLCSKRGNAPPGLQDCFQPLVLSRLLFYWYRHGQYGTTSTGSALSPSQPKRALLRGCTITPD